MMGFKSFWPGTKIIAGIETMHMIKKGQMECPDGSTVSAADQFYEGLAEFPKPVELAAGQGYKKRCGHRPKGCKIRVSNQDLGARLCILP